MTDRPIRAEKLAAKLAEGLAAVVPAEMEVSVAGPVVSLGERGGRGATVADLRGEDEAIGWTLEPLLDQFQDEVAETLAEPWPAVSPGPMPMPFVELRDGRVLAGFGDPADPAMTVLSVALEDLR